jgi:hypothetical protein
VCFTWLLVKHTILPNEIYFQAKIRLWLQASRSLLPSLSCLKVCWIFTSFLELKTRAETFLVHLSALKHQLFYQKVLWGLSGHQNVHQNKTMVGEAAVWYAVSYFGEREASFRLSTYPICVDQDNPQCTLSLFWTYLAIATFTSI